jgi:hypothetical protein
MPPVPDYSARNPGTLFPPYLQLGSSGPAVFVLQLILQAMGRTPIVVNGKFDSVTEDRVKELQEILGFTGSNVDGCFGPATRARLKEYDGGVGVDALMASDFAGGTQWTYDGEMQPNVWPCHPADRQENQCRSCSHARHDGVTCSVFMGGENDARCECTAHAPGCDIPHDGPCAELTTGGEIAPPMQPIRDGRTPD